MKIMKRKCTENKTIKKVQWSPKTKVLNNNIRGIMIIEIINNEVNLEEILKKI